MGPQVDSEVDEFHVCLLEIFMCLRGYEFSGQIDCRFEEERFQEARVSLVRKGGAVEARLDGGEARRRAQVCVVGGREEGVGGIGHECERLGSKGFLRDSREKERLDSEQGGHRVPPTSHMTSFAALSILQTVVALLQITSLLALATYIAVKQKKSLHLALASIRAALGLIAAAWLILELARNAALWDVIDSFVNADAPYKSLTLNHQTLQTERDTICVVTTCIAFGLIEPGLLLMLTAMVWCKANDEPRPFTRILRWSLICILPCTFLQALFLGLQHVNSWSDSIFFRPQPAIEVSTNDENGNDATPPPPPPPIQISLQVYRWWHQEGCAVSIASLGTLAVAIIIFEIVWTLWCMRLRRLLINLKLRRRLIFVQIAFTLSPMALLLLRVTRLIWPERWVEIRRWIHMSEMAVVFLSCGVIACDFLWRPVRESPRSADMKKSSISLVERRSSTSGGEGSIIDVRISDERVLEEREYDI